MASDDESNPFDTGDWDLGESNPGAPVVDDEDDDDLDWGIETNEQDSVTQQVISMPASSMDSNESQSTAAVQAPTINDQAKQPSFLTQPASEHVAAQKAALIDAAGNSQRETAESAVPVQTRSQNATPAVQSSTRDQLISQEVQEATIHHEPEIVPEPMPQDSRQQEQAASKAGGWSAGWNFSALKGSLTAIAAGAVRDVKELTGSFQQALAEVQDNDEDEDKDYLETKPDMQQSEVNTAQREPVNKKSGVDEGVADGEPGVPPVDMEASRSPGPSEDEARERLEDDDEPVDLIAAGAAKAFSSLWGGLSAVARNTTTLVSKVAEPTKVLHMAQTLVTSSVASQDVAQLQAAAASSAMGVAASVARLGHRLETGLESVGRTALGILEEVTGQHAGTGTGHQFAGDDSLGNITGHGSRSGQETQASPGGGVKSFEDLHYLYGGQQLCDDLEALANECARIANRARAKLEAGQQSELDAVLALLGPIFSQPLTGNQAGGAAMPGLDAAAQAQEQLEHRYVPITFLCQDSQTRAKAFQTLLQAAAAAAAAKSTPASPVKATPPPSINTQVEAGITAIAAQDSAEESTGQSTAQAAPGTPTTPSAAAVAARVSVDDWGELQGEGLDGSTDVVTHSSGPAALYAALLQLQAHAFKRMAELLTAQLQLLYDHGMNLAAPARSVDIPAGSAISWPHAAAHQATLVRQQAQRMSSDLSSVSSAYISAVTSALQHLASITQQESLQAKQGNASGVWGTEQPASLSQVDNGNKGSPSVDNLGGHPDQAGGVQAGDDDSGQPHVTANWDDIQDLGANVCGSLSAARKTALSRLEEGFRGLLYPVLVRQIVQHIAGPDNKDELVA